MREIKPSGEQAPEGMLKRAVANFIPQEEADPKIIDLHAKVRSATEEAAKSIARHEAQWLDGWMLRLMPPVLYYKVSTNKVDPQELAAWMLKENVRVHHKPDRKVLMKANTELSEFIVQFNDNKFTVSIKDLSQEWE